MSGEDRTKSWKRQGRLSPFRLSVICSLSLPLLSACLATAEIGAPQTGSTQSGAAPRIGPQGASLAVVGIEGPPDEIRARFHKLFSSAAQNRDVTLAEAEQASYRLRGFLTASPAENATRLTYVLDVYDRLGKRVRRLTREAGVSVDADPWRAVDEKSLNVLAERGADDVAAFLATTPEAAAAMGGEAGVSVIAVEREQSPTQPSALAAVEDKH